MLQLGHKLLKSFSGFSQGGTVVLHELSSPHLHVLYSRVVSKFNPSLPLQQQNKLLLLLLLLSRAREHVDPA